MILNKENQIEYYTVAEETDGYSVWKYTLIENPEEQESSNGTIFSWEKEAVSWLEGIKKEISYGRITAFTGEDQKEYAWYILANKWISTKKLQNSQDTSHRIQQG